MPKSCKYGGLTKANENCSEPGDDGLPVQCIGQRSQEKHNYLSRYLGASAGPRGSFVPPRGDGGAAYVDLFAGPGRARVQETGALVDGSPLLALNHTRSPFTTLILCDVDPENVSALNQRTAHDDRVRVVEGDCNVLIDQITQQIPPLGLNLALIDPFGVKPLDFETIRALASFTRMDILLHFPTMDLKRNLEQNREKYSERVTRFLGTDAWTKKTQRAKQVPQLVEILRGQLQQLGYTDDAVRTTVSIDTSKRIPIYHLLYASKHAKGDQIWKSILQTHASGQKRLPFEE